MFLKRDKIRFGFKSYPASTPRVLTSATIQRAAMHLAGLRTPTARLLLWTWLAASTALTRTPACGLRSVRRPRLAVVPRMQEEADQPEPDAGLAASLQNRRDALAQDASLRARRGALEQERAPPAVPLEREHLEVPRMHGTHLHCTWHTHGTRHTRHVDD